MEQLLEEDTDHKVGICDDIVRLLKRILRWCICVLTCGCVNPAEDIEIEENMNKVNLPSSEKRLILDLREKFRRGSDVNITASEIQILEKISFYENIHIQRIAALCYLRMSQTPDFVLHRSMLLTLTSLVSSVNVKVHKPACLAVYNFLRHRTEKNRRMLVEEGVMTSLNGLLSSTDKDVLVAATASIALLSAISSIKRHLATKELVSNVILLTSSSKTEVQRNVVGTLLNLTHDPYLIDDIVQEGAIPPLVNLLSSKNSEIQFYTTAILCNLATKEKYRTMILAVGFFDAVRYLLEFLVKSPERLQSQACLTLKNFTSDIGNQTTVVRLGVLDILKTLIKVDSSRILVPALSLLQNLSIYPSNWDEILDREFHLVLFVLMPDCTNSEAQIHSAVVVRNLAMSDRLGSLVDAGCVQSIASALLDPLTITPVQSELTACLTVVARDEEARLQIIEIKSGALFSKLIALASISSNSDVQYNSAGVIGQLSLSDLPNHLKQNNAPGLFVFIDNFLKSYDSNFVHLALLTLPQILKDYYFSRMFKRQHIGRVVSNVVLSSHPPDVISLAQSILQDL